VEYTAGKSAFEDFVFDFAAQLITYYFHIQAEFDALSNELGVSSFQDPERSR
jgi:hypothetical protein